MACRLSGDKPLSEPMMVRLQTHICVTQHLWVDITHKIIWLFLLNLIGYLVGFRCFATEVLSMLLSFIIDFYYWVVRKVCISTKQIHSPALQWRHNGCDSVSNHQPHDCLPKDVFRRKSKETSKLRVTGLCEGNSPVTGEFPAQMASDAKNVSFDDVIMYKYDLSLESGYCKTETQTGVAL